MKSITLGYFTTLIFIFTINNVFSQIDSLWTKYDLKWDYLFCDTLILQDGNINFVYRSANFKFRGEDVIGLATFDWTLS